MVHTLPTMTDRQLADPEFFTSQLLAWFEEHGRDFPWRQTDDPYRILICEVLLRRSRSSTVSKIVEGFFERWPTPAALAAAETVDVMDVIRPLGLTKRAQQLIDLGRALDEASNFPDSIDALMELPGVGRYAAAATLGEPTVDGTSARVYRRYFGRLDASEHKTVDEDLWQLATTVLHPGADPRRNMNWAVLDLAAEVCRPAHPRCDVCPLASGCEWAIAAGRPGMRHTSMPSEPGGC